MSPGSLPRNGVFCSTSKMIPNTISTAPRRINIFAISPMVTLSGKEFEDFAKRRAHILARDDHIDHTMIEHEFGALEPRGKLLLYRLFDHSRPGKPDEAFRLCNNNVAKHGEARSHAAEGGVC